MQKKAWSDCPVCGSKGTMRREKRAEKRMRPRGYPPVDIDDLEGQFCKVCGDGFWSPRSQRKITDTLAEHCARYDSERVVAAELLSVKDAAQQLEMTVQGIHKMMKEGRLRFVYAGNMRLPLRKEVEERRGAPHPPKRRSASTRSAHGRDPGTHKAAAPKSSRRRP